jgi:segregation and condensation protein B
MSASEIRNIVEAALLAAGKSLTLNELSQIFDESGAPRCRHAIRAAIESLAVDYAARPIEIKETGAGWRVQVRRAYGRHGGAIVAGAAAALFARAAGDPGA